MDVNTLSDLFGMRNFRAGVGTSLERIRSQRRSVQPHLTREVGPGRLNIELFRALGTTLVCDRLGFRGGNASRFRGFQTHPSCTSWVGAKGRRCVPLKVGARRMTELLALKPNAVAHRTAQGIVRQIRFFLEWMLE